MEKRTQSQTMRKVVEEAGRCELCGSKRGLEAHHIVPVVCGGDDSEDNLICVCYCCHAKLTPRKILCRIGINKTKERNAKIAFKLALYDKIDEYSQKHGASIAIVFDAIEDL